MSGSLAAEFPGGVGAASAAAEASGGSPVAAGNGAADCVGGFDAAAGRFAGGVGAADTVFFEGSGQGANSAALTDAGALAAFVGPGTISVAFTPASDTEVDLPAAFDSLAVAQGQIEASVTYTYTPGPGGGGGGGGGGAGQPPGGSALPVTGASSGEVAVLAGIAVLVGVGVVLAARRWRNADGGVGWAGVRVRRVGGGGGDGDAVALAGAVRRACPGRW